MLGLYWARMFLLNTCNKLKIFSDTLGSTNNALSVSRLRHFDHTCSGAKYELGKEVGRRHFGHTCSGLGKNGEIKDHPIAVNIISKVKVQISILMIILVEVIFGISIMISTLW
ncbi:hypothetical protein Bca4012_028395 [Brassica carinata]|uniref:Uncharacterized protein n=1 Tax=Brassica carinata TaxID=52824 RepID=A0A8X7RRQ2_BRACI|nr:hypothetical protein Bca52824_050118 [Brassica carinata]